MEKNPPIQPEATPEQTPFQKAMADASLVVPLHPILPMSEMIERLTVPEVITSEVMKRFHPKTICQAIIARQGQPQQQSLENRH